MSYGPDYNSEDKPVCRHCGIELNASDDLAMDSGYCSEVCHVESIDDEDLDDDLDDELDDDEGLDEEDDDLDEDDPEDYP